MKIIEPKPFRVYQRDIDSVDVSILIDLENRLDYYRTKDCLVFIQCVKEKEIFLEKKFFYNKPKTFLETNIELKIGTYDIVVKLCDNNDIIEECVINNVSIGDLWVLAGQSNMKGFGKLEGCEKINNKICVYNLDSTWSIAKDPLVYLNESRDPLYWTVDKENLDKAIFNDRKNRTQGSGLGITFGKEILANTSIPVGLVMCAKGSTDMDKWLPNENERTLYNSMKDRIEEVGGHIKGILWYQGESDAIELKNKVFKEKFTYLLESIRKDLKDDKLPFIYAQLSVYYLDENISDEWNDVQLAQYDVEKLYDNFEMVPTNDSVLSDIIHLNTNSLKNIGKRMAYRALDIAYNKPIYKKGPRPDDNGITWNDDRNKLILPIIEINGQLEKVDNVYGFKVFINEIEIFPKITIESKSICFYFNESIAHKVCIYHGIGLNPLVNVIDCEGIPLVTFLLKNL